MNELEIKIKKWLDEQGYPLEMEIASNLIKNDFNVIQSNLYIDPETEEKREIDICASIRDMTGFLELMLILECKKANKPWIVFTSEDTLATYNPHHTFGFKTKYAKDTLIKHDIENFRDMRKNIPWWWLEGERIGYSVVQAFTSGTDNSFKAQMSAIKAAYAIREEKNKSIDSIGIFFPVIIIDGELFECYLSKNGKIQINKKSKIFLQNTYYQNNLEGVNIILSEKEYIFEIIKDIKIMMKYFENILKSDIDSLYK